MRSLINFVKNHRKWLNTELIFYVAIFFLPFENFFFAPSSGWAAITPVILMLYTILNYKAALKALLKLRKIIFFFIFAITLATVTAFLNNVALQDYVNSFVPLFLGAASLFSFYVFYDKKKDKDYRIEYMDQLPNLNIKNLNKDDEKIAE